VEAMEEAASCDKCLYVLPKRERNGIKERPC
jgi:hypothetical protein